MKLHALPAICQWHEHPRPQTPEEATETAEETEMSRPAQGKRPGMRSNKPTFSPQEQQFIKSVLSGISIDKAAEKAGVKVTSIVRGAVFDEILAQYGRLSLKWKTLVEKSKKCLEFIIDDTEEKGATKVQACKVVLWCMLQQGAQHFRDEEDLTTRDDAADVVLGTVMPFEDKRIM